MRLSLERASCGSVLLSLLNCHLPLVLLARMGKGGGGGGLRLLPHKSWNVWNSDNVARVERDEQQHDQQQRQRQQRDRLAQHNQRIATLRDPSQPPLDDDQQATAALAEEKGSGGTELVAAAGQQSFGRFAAEGGQPWYLRGDHEKDARHSRQERAHSEQQQQRSRAETVLRRIRTRAEERKDEAVDDERQVRLGELLGGEKKEADDPLDVMRYYVQRTKDYQRLHELILDPPPSRPASRAPPLKRESDRQTAEVIELSSGSEGDSDSSQRHSRRHRNKHASRHRSGRSKDRQRDESGNTRSERRRRRVKDDETDEEEEERSRKQRRTQIVELLNQLDGEQSIEHAP